MGNRFMHYIDKSDSAEEGTVSQIIFGYYSLTWPFTVTNWYINILVDDSFIAANALLLLNIYTLGMDSVFRKVSMSKHFL